MQLSLFEVINIAVYKPSLIEINEVVFVFDATAPSGPGPPHSRGF